VDTGQQRAADQDAADHTRHQQHRNGGGESVPEPGHHRGEPRHVAPFVYTGLGIVKPQLFASETAEVFRLAPFFHAAAAKGRLYGVRLDGLWVHVGRPESIAEAEIAIDRSTLGHPGKFSFCVAEDEEDTTWLSLSEQRGLPKEASAVTVMAAGAPRQIMNEWTTKPEEILETFAADMRANLRHYSIHPGNYALIFPKQLREHLQAAKWSKTDIANFIHERARIHRREWADVGKGAVVRDRGDRVYPALPSPDQLLVIAAGGPAGGFGAIIPPWLGNKSRAVTLPIGACVDCEPPQK